MAWSNYEPNAKKHKYGAQKLVIEGISFDSQREARRWAQLKLLEAAGEIYNLQRQFRYVLIPIQREPDTVGKRGGKIKGKVLERECSYVADFVYIDTKIGKLVVEDAKGYRTPEYKIKRKLMLWVYGIRIKEV